MYLAIQKTECVDGWDVGDPAWLIPHNVPSQVHPSNVESVYFGEGCWANADVVGLTQIMDYLAVVCIAAL
jgi:hypothetical protein